MVASGMADFGYQFISLDDCWMVRPDAQDPEIGGEPRDPPEPSVPTVAPRHEGPGRLHPFQGAEGRNLHLSRTADLRRSTPALSARGARRATVCAWGFDLLKYDWCSYGKIAKDESLATRQEPYRKMAPF